MSQVIWKFNFTPDRRDIKIDMPKSAKPIHVGLDAQGTPAVWVEVRDEHGKDMEPRIFTIVGTGHLCPIATWDYLGSFNTGPFVWHVYYFEPNKETA